MSVKNLGRRPRDRSIPRVFVKLDEETRLHVFTADAAHHLGLSEQTLRGWACFGDGPIKPTKIPGSSLLRWPVSEIKLVLSTEKSDDVPIRSRRPVDLKAASARTHSSGVTWKSLASRAMAALEKWESAAKSKDREAMDSARKTRDAVLADFRAKTGAHK